MGAYSSSKALQLQGAYVFPFHTTHYYYDDIIIIIIGTITQEELQS